MPHSIKSYSIKKSELRHNNSYSTWSFGSDVPLGTGTATFMGLTRVGMVPGLDYLFPFPTFGLLRYDYIVGSTQIKNKTNSSLIYYTDATQIKNQTSYLLYLNYNKHPLVMD